MTWFTDSDRCQYCNERMAKEQFYWISAFTQMSYQAISSVWCFSHQRYFILEHFVLCYGRKHIHFVIHSGRMAEEISDHVWLIYGKVISQNVIVGIQWGISQCLFVQWRYWNLLHVLQTTMEIACSQFNDLCESLERQTEWEFVMDSHLYP